MTSYPFLNMAAANAKCYFRFRICWCRCLQKGKVHQQTKFRRAIFIGGGYVTTSDFEIQTSAILEFYFRFWSRPVRRNLNVIQHQATEFRPNRSNHCGNMTSYPFLKMAAATAKYYFRVCICWCHCRQKVKVSQQTKFLRDISIGGWDITTSGFEIQTSAILEIYLRFRFRPFARYLDIILQQAIDFRSNRSNHWGNMTLYALIKMAAATAEYCFRFRICWCHCRQKVKFYQQTKFRRDISIGGWDITTSGFEIQTSAILEFYLLFWSRPDRRNMHVILHQATEFRPNRSNHWKYDVISIS